jgi:hypothetical protein
MSLRRKDMDDLTKLLDGSVDDVKTGIGGKSHDDLLKLKTAEQAGQKRKGVLTALDGAIEAADVQRAGGVVQLQPADPARATMDDTHQPVATHSTVAADFDGSPRAEIAPATDIDTSGAPQQIVPDVDLDHPAVDNDPRADTTETMNRIDFNDPVKPGHEVVEEALKPQG